MNSSTASEEVHLYQPSTTIRYRGAGFALPATVPVGANPPTGVVLDYYLKSSPKDGITLEILDAKGAVIRKYSSKKASEGASPDEEEFGISRPGEALPVEAGLNRFVWDMRSEASGTGTRAVELGRAPEWAARGARNVSGQVDSRGEEFCGTRGDPEGSARAATQADLEKQNEFAQRIRDRVNAAHEAVNQIRSVRGQLDALKKRLAADANAKPVGWRLPTR